MAEMIEITRPLTQYIMGSDFSKLPEDVRQATHGAFINWFGCVLGGCQDSSITIVLKVLEHLSGREQATVIGRRKRLDIASAAFVNCMSAKMYSYDDTHLATVCHPTGPVAAAILALAEQRPINGRDFLHALYLGIEIECRLSAMLVLPPARIALGLNTTGLTGGIAAAAAVSKLLGLDQRQTANALGIAANQAAGLREGHASNAGKISAPQASRCGLTAALMAEAGLTSSAYMLEGKNGFANCYGNPANPAAVTDGLGSRFEILSNVPKPFPCAIVIHPIIDALLRITRGVPVKGDDIERIDLRLNPLALDLTSRKEPRNADEAQVSLYHWTAVVPLRARAGFAESRDKAVQDPDVIALRRRVNPVADPAISSDSAHVTVVFRDGRSVSELVEHARGSVENPMTVADMEGKFTELAAIGFPGLSAADLLRECWHMPDMDDVGGLVQRVK